MPQAREKTISQGKQRGELPHSSSFASHNTYFSLSRDDRREKEIRFSTISYTFKNKNSHPHLQPCQHELLGREV